MKRLPEVKKEIDEILQLNLRKEDRKVLSSAKKRLPFLKTIHAYLESSPTKEFLLAEKKRLENRVKLIKDGFGPWSGHNQAGNNDLRKLKAEYAKLMDTKTLERHLKAIRFILG